MRNLIKFILDNAAWILFLIFQMISIAWIFNKNPYQRNILLVTGNQVSGHMHSLTNQVSSYFFLKTENQMLLKSNAELQQQLFQLETQLEKYQFDQEVIQAAQENPNSYQEIFATVINNSVSKLHNYITLNKGSNDGIETEMGVVNQNGVIGIVCMVSPNYSKVISLLNTKLRFSCKIKNDEAIGSFHWNGENPEYAIIDELPRHSVFEVGDTIVTSGFSSAFPEGILVGVIDQLTEDKKDFNTVIVKLSADFYRLKNVRVVKIVHSEEQIQLEKKSL